MPFEPIIFDDIKYDKQYVQGLKQPLLEIRDCLITQNHFEFAMALSQIHVILCYYCDNVESEK